MQRTPAGFPFGIPGIADVILGATQHAPQPKRHSIKLNSKNSRCKIVAKNDETDSSCIESQSESFLSLNFLWANGITRTPIKE